MKDIDKLLSLEGKVAVVTGGAKGIGQAISYRLAEAGATVVIADVDTDGAEKAAIELNRKGWKAKPVTVDMSKEEDIKNIIEICASEYGRL